MSRGEPEIAIRSQRLYTGRVLGLRVDTVRLADGRQATREVVEHPGAVAIVPLTDDGGVVLVRQYRYAVGEHLLEIPAGKLEPGEDPEKCAHRELAEEVGLRAGVLRRIALFYTSPGFSSEVMHLFVASDLTPCPALGEADESIGVERVPLSAVREMIGTGAVRDAKTLVGLLLAAEGRV